MLSIKLQRIGKKHQPSYRVVVAVGRSKMAAPPVEDLGSYHPKTKLATLKNERVTYWIGVGAQPTMTVHNLLVKQGVISKPKKAIKMQKPAVAVVEPKAEVAAPAAAVVEEAPAAVAEPRNSEDITSVSDVEVVAEMPKESEAAIAPKPAHKDEALDESNPDAIEITLTEIKE